MKHYIGLDAHSATCTFVVLDDGGEVSHRAVVKTSEGTLLGFLSTLSGEKILAVEESHVSQWVYVLLHEKVEKLIVCNPFYLGKHQGPKTDYRDALRLAQELRGNFLKPIYHDESKWIQLRVLISGYLDLVTEIVRTKNRLKAVFRSEVLDTSDTRFYTSPERSKELSHEHGYVVLTPRRDSNGRDSSGRCAYALRVYAVADWRKALKLFFCPAVPLKTERE